VSRRSARGWLWLPLVVGCAYYNAMWSAERSAKEARRLEARGRTAEARAQWSRAAVKAETVLVRHPKSRWADDALVLRGEALARTGNCAAATRPLEEALRTAGAAALTERAALAAAECALGAGDPVRADRLLAYGGEWSDGRRRSHAAFLAGQAAAARGDAIGAAAWFARSGEPGAGAARARALIAAGQVTAALAYLDTVARRPFVETEWAGLLDDLAGAPDGGPAVASGALDRLRANARIPSGAQARLLLADGDRLLDAGARDEATARYASVMRLVPDSAEAAAAAVRDIRTRLARADELADVAALRQELERVPRDEARALARAIGAVLDPSGSEADHFRAAELARDSFDAPLLAGRLFVGFAADYPQSLFAPKALVAALPLAPERRDSLVAVLQSTYAGSPYTLALYGESSPAFSVLEDSLAQALGLSSPRPAAVPRVGSPWSGPRGPALDPPLGPSAAAGAARTTASPARPTPPPPARPARRADPKAAERQ